MSNCSRQAFRPLGAIVTAVAVCDGMLVVDFGIALAAKHAGGKHLTDTGLSLGTPHYMSPEQKGAQAVDVTLTHRWQMGEARWSDPAC